MRDYFTNYDPEHFAKICAEIGDEVKTLLNEEVSVALALGAVDMRRTSAHALANLVVERIGKRAQDHYFRRFFGHILCHLMKELGCEIEQRDVRIAEPVLFTRAARYRRLPPPPPPPPPHA